MRCGPPAAEFTSFYVMTIPTDLSRPPEEVTTFASFHKLGMHTAEYSEVSFSPEYADCWVGRFEKGERVALEDAALSTPEPDHACVISAGAGYWVNVKARTAVQLQCLPITSALPSKNHELILISTWRDIFAYGPFDVQWSLENIADDRLRCVAIEPDVLIAEGFDGGHVRFEIAIKTGEILRKTQEL
jgi:hypothetical protein